MPSRLSLVLVSILGAWMLVQSIVLDGFTIAMRASYEDEKLSLPIPEFFVHFGLFAACFVGGALLWRRIARSSR